MIKVLKHGDYTFVTTCKDCGCEFSYQYIDVENTGSVYFVKCPECGNLVNHSYENKLFISCDCFHKENGEDVCWGTKEKDNCSCGGNKANCTFYRG